MTIQVGTQEPVVTRASWLTLIAMTGALAMTMLDQTVVTVALPTMSRDLSLGGSGQQWVISGYVLAMAAAVALSGRLGTKFGPVTIFKYGVGAFFVASVFCGFTPKGEFGSTWIITARVAQGLGAALMMTVSATIVMAAFPTHMRGRAMGAYVGISQLFLAVGPLVGGVLTEHATWRLVFWLNVPVGFAALVLVALAKPANPTQCTITIRPVSAVLLMGSIGVTVYGLQQTSLWGWTSPATWSVVATGLAMGAVLVWRELHSSDPVIHLRLLAKKAFTGNLLVLIGVQFGLLAIILYSTLYFQNLLGFSPVQAGFASMPLIVSLMVAAQIAGRWYDRSGARPSVMLGLLMCTVGAGIWTATLTDISYPSKVPGMILLGLGLGLVMSPVNTDALSRVTPGERPQASGIVQTVRQLGGTLGVAIVGSVILTHETPGLPVSQRPGDTAAAIQNGYIVVVAVFAMSLVAAIRYLPTATAASRRPRERNGRHT